MSNKIQPIRLKWRKKSSKILQSYLVSPVLAESLKKMKSEENEKIEIYIYVKILARTGERSYFYQIFMRRKQAIPLQGSELFYKAEKKYCWRLFELPRYVVQQQQKQKVKTNLAAIFDDNVPVLGKTDYFFREKVIRRLYVIIYELVSQEWT